MQFSTTVRNARLDAIETAIGASPTMRILGGAAMPANPAAADAGTVLVETTLPSDWMAAAASGSKAKAGTWEDTSANATGLARYYRIYAGATCHIQGLCSQAWAASTPYILNQQVNNNGNVYICTTAGTSASSGGPSGTGTGITDGSAVWDYVGPAEMVLANVSIATTQNVTINTFTMTDGNA